MRRVVPLLFSIAAIAAAETTDKSFVGPEACAPCHRAEFDKQNTSRHALALRPIAQSPVSKELKEIADGAFSVAYSPTRDAVQVQVNGPGKKIEAVLAWAFGAGAQGITPVGVYRGEYFEHRYSYYSAPKQSAPTFGHPKRVKTAETELGILQDGNTVSR